MSRGESIEYIAKGLQERCGTFCSTDDVIGFRAIEHLRKAKEIGIKDPEGINYHLTRAIELFQVINNNITLEKLKESIEIMISLNEFPKAIKFALNISSGIDPGNLALQYVSDGKLNNDERGKYYAKRHEIFETIFQLLVDVDKLALENSIIKDESQINFINIRNDSYDIALKFEDTLFQFELYEWFISQDASEKLLEIDTNYILQFLEQKAQESLVISDLLWIYQSKKNNYYEAALISYNLALSDFEISLTQRNEYLSRAIGFCNCITLPSQRQQVIELSKLIEEVFEASNVQYDLLIEINNDEKIPEEKKGELIDSLNGKILTVSELFNDFATVLRYHEIILQIFKISDFRNSEEILSRYFEFFEEYKHDKNLLISRLTKIGRKISNSEFVLPTSDLIPIITNIFQEEGYPVIAGEIVQIFVDIGISFDKLYHVLRDLIDLKDFNNEFYQAELKELIKIWYKEDLKVREILQIESFDNIDLAKVHELIIKTGDVL
jgi:nuclear pore complex protein Nup155